MTLRYNFDSLPFEVHKEMFAFIAVVMMLLYLVAIEFPIPYTPLVVFQFALRFLFLATALFMVCGTSLNKEYKQGS